MEIGIFTTYFPYKDRFNTYKNKQSEKVWGGVGEVCYNIVLGLEKRGHSIKIFTTSCSKDTEIIKSGNIEVYRYKKLFRFQYTDISLSLFSEPLKYDVDVVHLQGTPINPGPLAGYYYAKRKKMPFILSYHHDPEAIGSSIIKKIIISNFNILFMDKILKDSQIITTLSIQNLKQSKFLKKWIHKVKIIPNGINLKLFEVPYSKYECRRMLKLPEDKKIILFVGALMARKGIHTLLESMELVKKFHPDVILVLVGEGLLKRTLKELTKKLGIEQNVIFAGFIDENLKPLYYHSADIFVLPSFLESFGLVLLEASTCRLPLVVSNLEAFRSIIKDGYNGLFTKVGDKKDLAEKIIYLLENEDSRIKIGRNARRVAEEFSWDKVVEAFEEIYNKLIN